MNKIIYWLLDHVVLGRYPLADLLKQDIQHPSRRPRDVEQADIHAALQTLFHRGDILAKHIKIVSGDYAESAFFVPTSQEIEAGLAGAITLFYGLTAQGGVQWESVSSPNWANFIDDSYPAENTIQYVCHDRNWLRHYLALLPDLKRIEVVPGTERWTVLQPWQTTYWKLLPVGHCVVFRSQPVRGHGWEDRREAVARARQLKQWYTSLLNEE